MRATIFLSGLLIIGLGMGAMRTLDEDAGFAFLQGALTLGGGLVICGLFSLRMRWHGVIGAGVLGLLGFARGLGNVPELMQLADGTGVRGPAPVMELGVTLISLFLLLRVLLVLKRERARRMIESLK